jgi:hypothetical protein
MIVCVTKPSISEGWVTRIVITGLIKCRLRKCLAHNSKRLASPVGCELLPQNAGALPASSTEGSRSSHVTHTRGEADVFRSPGMVLARKLVAAWTESGLRSPTR